jgi:prepilin-type N-terminal cleavage/methylation domain-containing protein
MSGHSGTRANGQAVVRQPEAGTQEPSRASEAGFTLLEVIIALTIMVLAFTAILSVESGGINAAEKTHQINIVAMLARNKMIETEYAIEGKTFDEVKKDDGGNFDGYPDFRWTSQIKEVKFPALNLQGVGSGASGDNADKGATAGGSQPVSDLVTLMTKLITNFLSKAVREVDVTIYWKRPSGEQKFTISTFWVDLNHEFELNP